MILDKNSEKSWRSAVKNSSKVYYFYFLIFVIFCFGLFMLFKKVNFSSIDFNGLNHKFASILKQNDSSLANNENSVNNNVINSSLPEWDLSSALYLDMESNQIDEDISSVNKMINNFVFHYQNANLNKFSKKQFLEFLHSYSNILDKSSRISLFAYLLYAKDSLNPEVNQFYSKINDIETKWSSSLSFIKHKLYALKPKQLSSFYKEKDIYFYKPYIDRVLKYSSHRLSPELDKFNIEKSSSLVDPIVRLYDQTLSGITINYDNQNYTLTQALGLLFSDDQKTRHEVSKKINEKLGENSNIFLFVFNTILKDKSVEDKWRNFKSPLHAELLANEFDDELLSTVVNTVTKNYSNTAHRYYKLKAKAMGVEKLDYSDRNAPIYKLSKTYDWAFTKNAVLNSYMSFSKDLYNGAVWFFDNNRIDAITQKGKMSGAFCTHIEPFVLMNFTGKFNDVSTLAHEIGHGIQMKLSYTKYGPLMSSSPLVLAEVPSTFGEALLMKYMMMSTTSKQEQIAILSSMIENAINTITRQIAFHVFEVKSHELRKQKELTAEDMQKIWIEISREQLGDAIYVGAEHANYWSYISHFVHHPFYVHSYAVADLTTYALLNVYNSNSFDNFESRYLDFITNITVKNYSTLMKDFGFDVYQEQYWQNGMNYIENLVNQLESLLNDVNGK